MRLSNNLENKTPSDIYWTVQLIYMKVQVHSSSEPPLEYNQVQTCLRNQAQLWPSLPTCELQDFYSFRTVLEGKLGKEIPEMSRLEFLKKIPANNFALSDAEDNTSGPLNRRSITDLPLLQTLLPIYLKSLESSFWEVMDSFDLIA